MIFRNCYYKIVLDSLKKIPEIIYYDMGVKTQ